MYVYVYVWVQNQRNYVGLCISIYDSRYRSTHLRTIKLVLVVRTVHVPSTLLPIVIYYDVMLACVVLYYT